MTSRLIKSIATGLGLLGSQASAEGSYNGYEAPPYQVEREVGGAEVRLYQPHLTAEVTVKGAQSQALRRGFSELAGYIFGGNTTSASVSMTTPVTQRPSEKIAMTTPVTQSGDGDIWTVSFTMPREYTRETLPVPNTDTIRFVETTPERQIVLRFSGIAGTAKLAKQDATLQAIAAQAGVSLGAGPFYYFYDEPLTLPWNRRNEVAYVVE